MSRARSIVHNGEEHWFDTKRNGAIASDEKLELLATVECVDLDDLLDTVLTQGEVIRRLRLALGDDPIPTEVLERRQRWRAARQVQPCCRKCGKEGDSTKHHFVNKWILRELESYERLWAPRSKNCIPMCIHCHRLLHSRDDSNKSIYPYLTNTEKAFAEKALSALEAERPRLLIHIGRGDACVYEARLIKDWMNGQFRIAELPELKPHQLRVVA